MAVGMEDLTGNGSVLKKVLNQGMGCTVPEGAMVRVHYNGYLEYCDEPYDSSRLRNREQQFKLGKGQLYSHNYYGDRVLWTGVQGRSPRTTAVYIHGNNVIT